jgi:hypothetical protein
MQPQAQWQEAGKPGVKGERGFGPAPWTLINRDRLGAIPLAIITPRLSRGGGIAHLLP